MAHSISYSFSWLVSLAKLALLSFNISAWASSLKEFTVPYVLINCHNTLCAVGGTINEDDHVFALICAHKYSLNNGEVKPIHLELNNLSKQEKEILVDGCLINYYKVK